MKPTEELFSIIRQNFDHPDDFSIDDIEVFNHILCDTSFNKTWKLKLSEDFVRNYTDFANKGLALVTESHSKDRLSLGRTIKGTCFYDNGTCYAKIYLMKGLNLGNGITSDDVIKAEKSGVMIDGSIEFYADKYTCSVCGNDLSNFDACSHFPGNEYGGVMCFGIVEHSDNTVYSNYSIVTAGSLERAGMADFKEKSGEKYMLFGNVAFSEKNDNIKKLNINKQEALRLMEKELHDNIMTALKDLSEANKNLQLSFDRNKQLEDEIIAKEVEFGEQLGVKQQEIDMLKDEIKQLSEFKEAYLSVIEEEGIKAYGQKFDKTVLGNKTVEDLDKCRIDFMELSSKNINTGIVAHSDGKKVFANEDIYKTK